MKLKREPLLVRKPEPRACLDCGFADMLNQDGVCPSCATERNLDQAEYYDAKAIEDREWWDQQNYNQSQEKG